MAQVTVAQSVEDTAGGNPSLTGVTSGNVLVIVIQAGRYFGVAPDITACSGGTGGTWTRRVNRTQSEVGIIIFECVGNTASTVTCSLTGTYDEAVCTLFELTNGDAFDVAASNSAASGTALSSGATATLASDEDLAIGGGMCESGFTTFTAGGGYTEASEEAGGGYSSTSSYLEVTSTTGTTASYTSTTSAPWAAGVITIKPAAGGATGQPISKRMGGVNFMGQHGAGFASAIQRW